MPVKLLPHLRLLNPSLPVARFSSMKPNPPIKPSGVIPIFSRMFPHRIKYHTLSRKLGLPNSANRQLQQQQNQLSVRRFSTRSFGRRPGSGREVRATKSLIEDEAELSDWVSELRSDSVRTRLYSDSDNDGDNNDLGRGRGSGRPRSRDERSGKRRRESDSDDFGASNRSRGRDSFKSLSSYSRGKGGFRGDLDGEDEGFVSWKRENGFQGGKYSTMENRGGRGSDMGNRRDRGGGNRGGGEGIRKGGRGSDMWNRGDRGGGGGGGGGEGLRKGGRGSEMGNRLDRGAGGGGEGQRKGGRGSEMGNRQDRGGSGGGLRKGVKNLGRGGFVMSDEDDVAEEEEEEKLMDNFRELISDSEEDDDDGEDLFTKADSLSTSAIEDSSPISSRSSPGRTDSYLSETR